MTTATSEIPLSPKSVPLLDAFEPVPPTAWRALVESELKGAPFDKKLVHQTAEGIAVQPIYHRIPPDDLPWAKAVPGFFPYLRGSKLPSESTAGWEVSQDLICGDPRRFNESARHDLAAGLTSLNLHLDLASRAGMDPDSAQPGEVGCGGVSIATLEDLDRALDGIDLKSVGLFVRTGASALPFAGLMVAHLRKKGIPESAFHGCIEMDPLGVLSHEGQLPVAIADSYREMAHVARWAAENAPRLRTICVHGRPYHESGASAVQELAFALATGAEYLRAMTREGLAADTVASQMLFSFGISPQLFMEIAKLRAARVLWSRIVTLFGGSQEVAKMQIHARSSRYHQSLLDPHTNMLRVTVEAFAAALGGCDSMHTAPYDEVIREADDFSRRIARNTQLILKEESGIHRVVDPVGGSWYVESLTDQLAEKAWSLFQEVEARGGMHAALLEAWPQQLIANGAAQQAKEFALRKTRMVGVNHSANPGEVPEMPVAPDYLAIHRLQSRRIGDYRISNDNVRNTEVLSRLSVLLDAAPANLLESCARAAEAGATLGEISRTLRSSSGPGPTITPLCVHRLAEPFERLRAASARHGTGDQKPCCWLACFGPPKQHKARADFSRAFLELGGFDVRAGAGASSISAAVDDALASGAKVIVLCSTDDTYADLVAPFIERLGEGRGDLTLVLAGYPTDQVEALQAAGVDYFLHMRSNALELLQTLLKKAGVQP